ncbi:MAG TPA: DoxX family protein [Candidatus Dormibacteraeota bacterium]
MRKSDLGLLLLRVGSGGVLAVHGAPKLFGGTGKVPPPWLEKLAGPNYKQSWEQGGPENFGAALAKMGIPNPKVGAQLSGIAELGGGIGIALGAATPLASAVVTANMAVAIRKAHWKMGLYGQGGFEFPLVMALAFVAIGISGPGSISVDRLFGRA